MISRQILTSPVKFYRKVNNLWHTYVDERLSNIFNLYATTKLSV